MNKAYDQFKDKVNGLFHSLLWRIVMDQRFKGKRVAFVSNYNKNGHMIGIAEMDESGYFPTWVCFNETVTYDESQDILEELNRLIFGLTDEQAAKIQLSSMR
jgi:hypothetical protein